MFSLFVSLLFISLYADYCYSALEDAKQEIAFLKYELLKCQMKDIKRTNDDNVKIINARKTEIEAFKATITSIVVTKHSLSEVKFPNTNVAIYCQANPKNKCDSNLLKENERLTALIASIGRNNSSLSEVESSNVSNNSLATHQNKCDANLRIKIETQRAEIDYLKATLASIVANNNSLLENRNPSMYCRSLRENKCGNCLCVDDPALSDKYFCDCRHLKAKRDCLEFKIKGYNVSGIYKISMLTLTEIKVYCDMDSDQGGWTVIQRRLNGDTDFYQNWTMYKMGFGVLQREFWFGNDNLYLLTLQGKYLRGSELRVEIEDWEKNRKYASYSSVNFGREDSKYVLTVSGYNGTAGDSLAYHNNQKFTTFDQDNDNYVGTICSTGRSYSVCAPTNPSCAKKHRGAWWYNNCINSNLNGEYVWFGDDQPGEKRGIIWNDFMGYKYSLKFTEMKVRRKR